MCSDEEILLSDEIFDIHRDFSVRLNSLPALKPMKKVYSGIYIIILNYSTLFKTFDLGLEVSGMRTTIQP